MAVPLRHDVPAPAKVSVWLDKPQRGFTQAMRAVVKDREQYRQAKSFQLKYTLVNPSYSRQRDDV